jgi:hypothetical protein
LARGEITETPEDHSGVVVHRLKSPFGFLSPLWVAPLPL